MKGNVISLNEDSVTIALEHNLEDGCQACGLGDSCSLPKVEKITVDRNSQTRDLHLHEVVEVEMSSKKLLWLSASVYILPLFTMLLGGLLGMKFSENASILGAIGGLILGIIFNVKLNRMLSVDNIVDVRRAQ